MSDLDDLIGVRPITYEGVAYGVEPCSSCGGRLLPGQRREVTPGEWHPRHQVCPETTECAYCGDSHPAPHDGSCLL